MSNRPEYWEPAHRQAINAFEIKLENNVGKKTKDELVNEFYTTTRDELRKFKRTGVDSSVPKIRAVAKIPEGKSALLTNPVAAEFRENYIKRYISRESRVRSAVWTTQALEANPTNDVNINNYIWDKIIEDGKLESALAGRLRGAEYVEG